VVITVFSSSTPTTLLNKDQGTDFVSDYKILPRLTGNAWPLLAGGMACIAIQQLCLIGSSLGAYYATYLAHVYDLKAILINPAVHPYDSLEKYLGENHNYHSGEAFTFHRHHIDELKYYDIDNIKKPERFLVMLQTADEVLDYRQAVEKFPKSSLIIQEGGSHGFDGFDKMIPTVLEFAGIIDA